MMSDPSGCEPMLEDEEQSPSKDEGVEVMATGETLMSGTFEVGIRDHVEKTNQVSSQRGKPESHMLASEEHTSTSFTEEFQKQKDELNKLKSERDAIEQECAKWKAHSLFLETENGNLEGTKAESRKSTRKLQRERDALASDNAEWKRSAEYYLREARNLKAALTKQHGQFSNDLRKLRRELDELMTANSDLATSAEFARNGNQRRIREQQIKIRNQQDEITTLKEELEQVTLAEQRALSQAERAEEVAAEASATSSNLFQMLQMDVVKRSSTGRSAEFLNGDEIEAKTRIFQDESDDFLRDLADLFIPDQFESSSRGLDVHEYILDNILVPAAECALRQVSEFITDKRANLLALIGDDENLLTSNMLVRLLWSSSMQARTTEMIASGKTVDLTDQDLATQDEETKVALVWASQPETCNHSNMEGRHIGSFIRELFQLELWCRFSDPPCFLHPCVGEHVAYDPSHHAVKHMPNRTKRVATGRQVRVVYPGLYFAHPETKERNMPIPPKVKAAVVMF